MLTLDDAVLCSICGAKQILSGGWRNGRSEFKERLWKVL